MKINVWLSVKDLTEDPKLLESDFKCWPVYTASAAYTSPPGIVMELDLEQYEILEAGAIVNDAFPKGAPYLMLIKKGRTRKPILTQERKLDLVL
jgi:hypothetical protein